MCANSLYSFDYHVRVAAAAEKMAKEENGKRKLKNTINYSIFGFDFIVFFHIRHLLLTHTCFGLSFLLSFFVEFKCSFFYSEKGENYTTESKND